MLSRKALCLCAVLLLTISCLSAGCAKDSVQENPRNDSEQLQAVDSLDPALLITREDAEAILKEPCKEAAITTNPMGQQVCFYEPQTEGMTVRFVQLSVISSDAMTEQMKQQGYDAAQLFEDSKNLLEDIEEVPDYGDQAFWGGNGLKAGAGLHVLKGDVYFSVVVGLGEEAADLEAARELARKVLNRL